MRPRRTIELALCLAAAGAAALSVTAAADEPAPEDARWRILLAQQLKAEKSCDLNEILMYHELPLGDDIALDGRTSCVDGREFNFSRKRRHQKFEIELCQPTVC